MSANIPKTFDCMGLTISVKVKTFVASEEDHGFWEKDKAAITINKGSPEQLQEATFWHEALHAMLDYLGYDKLSKDEKFVDRLALCLHQLERTRE